MRKKSIREAVIVFFITIFLFELCGFLIGDNSYFWENRQILIPHSSFRFVGDEGFWTYKPNSEIDSSATYYFSDRNGWLEYRCKFNTNKFGLIDTNYDNQTKIDLLVLGDSLLEGQGGCPWLTRENLTKNNYSKIVINAGLYGAGVEDFLMLSNWLGSQVKANNLLLIVISNDFKRVIRRDWMKNNHDAISDDYEVSATGVSDSKLVEIGGDIYRAANKDFATKLDESLRYYSSTYRLVRILFADKKDETDRQIFEKNFDALRELRRKYPNLKIILVPQRDEVGLLGSKNADTKIVEKFFNEEGFNFSRCELELSDYMKVDGHPNRRGYEKIFKCFEVVTR